MFLIVHRFKFGHLYNYGGDIYRYRYYYYYYYYYYLLLLPATATY